jgi:uncharacterized protein involved in type VI secretion and phage assembly
LQRYRVELDSVAQKVGPEGLWKYFVYRIKLLAKADGLDYTKVIHKPASETLYPVEVIDFLSDLQGYTKSSVISNVVIPSSKCFVQIF